MAVLCRCIQASPTTAALLLKPPLIDTAPLFPLALWQREDGGGVVQLYLEKWKPFNGCGGIPVVNKRPLSAFNGVSYQSTWTKFLQYFANTLLLMWSSFRLESSTTVGLQLMITFIISKQFITFSATSVFVCVCVKLKDISAWRSKSRNTTVFKKIIWQELLRHLSNYSNVFRGMNSVQHVCS